MKKLFLTICMLLSLSAFSQEENFRPAQINFGFPLSSTNVKKAKEYTNGFSINLLVGISKNERSLALAGIGNIIANDATGLQIASVFNHIGNNGYGIAVTGVSNTVMQSYKGIQIAGVANYSGSGVGMQIAGVTNINNGANIGAQISGVANINNGAAMGLQISGVANINNGAAMGLQISGVTNINNGSFIGLQLSSVANIAGDVKGMQLSAVMNKAKKVKGVQFATLLNIAEESNFPIAFINIIRNGKMGVALTHDILNNKVVSLRSGGKYTYGILGFGFNNKITEGNRLVAEAGYGIHIPITEWFEINNELKATMTGLGSETSNNFGYFLSPSLTLLEHYNFFAGVSVNYFNSNSINSESILPNNSFWSKDGNDYIHRMFVGYQIGVQYIF